MGEKKLSHHPSQSNVGHLNYLIQDQHCRPQPQSVRSQPRRPSLTLLCPLFYHFGYMPNLIMLTRTVLRSTRLAGHRRSPLGRQSTVAIPNYSIFKKQI